MAIAEVTAASVNTNETGTANTTASTSATVAMVAGNSALALVTAKGSTLPVFSSVQQSGPKNAMTFIGGVTLSTGLTRIELWGIRGDKSVTNTAVFTSTWTNAGAGTISVTQWSDTNLDLACALVTTTASNASMSSNLTASVPAGSLLFCGYVANAANTFSAQAFTHAGTAFHVPETDATATGTDNQTAESCTTLVTAAATQGFTATDSAGTAYGMLIVAFAPIQQESILQTRQAVMSAATH